jgi:hypothetical protein
MLVGVLVALTPEPEDAEVLFFIRAFSGFLEDGVVA